MSRFFDRRFELLVNDLVFIGETGGRQFKIVFEILVDFGGFTSYADIAIYNLNSNSVNEVLVKGFPLNFRVGYKDTIDSIFSGHIVNILRERRGTNTITRILAKGGTQPASTNISETVGKGAKVPALVKKLTDKMGYALEIVNDDFNAIPPRLRGTTFNGNPRVLLDNLARESEFSYVTENKSVVVVKNGKSRKGTPLVVDQFNGMEGIPEISEIGADVVVRINPRIKIGSQIDIRSELSTFNFSNAYYQDIPAAAGTGIYNVYRLEHSGDSWGDAWSTVITGIRDGGSLAT